VTSTPTRRARASAIEATVWSTRKGRTYYAWENTRDGNSVINVILYSAGKEAAEKSGKFNLTSNHKYE
jgi:hypothetical protein